MTSQKHHDNGFLYVRNRYNSVTYRGIFFESGQQVGGLNSKKLHGLATLQKNVHIVSKV